VPDVDQSHPGDSHQESREKPGKQDARQGGSDKQDPGKEEQPKRPAQRWPWFLAGAVVLAFVAVVLVIIFAPNPDVWTDDAYVTVHYATVPPRISGQVATVEVDDNQVVKTGQVLVTLDPRDDETSVRMAEAALDRDRAQVNNAAANVARQPPLREQQQASVTAAQARLGMSQLDQRRYTNLAATGAGTSQQHQQADTTLRADQASLKSAQAALEASRRQMEVLQAQQSSSEGTVKADEAQLQQSRLNLSYTKILAPMDGMIGQRSVQTGNYVGPGNTLMILVPLDQVYIEANYREVDLRHVRPGQHVRIHLDAYNIDLDGVVDSVPPASGAAFAPIAPNNATGNFTKIVQRLPVKIVVTAGQPLAKLLRVGFSVETTIHTGLENVTGEQSDSADRVTAH